MIYSDRCPHCEKEVVVEPPYPGMCGGDETAELQQDCPECHEPIVGTFRLEFVLEGVRAA